MKRFLELIAVIALLNLGSGIANAEDPQVSVIPDVRTDPAAPAAGGSATASGGSAGPAAISSSEPVTVSSTTAPAPGAGQSYGSTSASGPGTSANAPLNAAAAEPGTTPPDGAPATTTSGPSADADASRTTVSTTDSGGVRATIVWNATGAFGASADGVGSAQDPTNAASCTTAEVTPGTPTDVNLGTACGGTPTTVSEDFSASEASGSGGGGTPSASSCLSANGSAGLAPSAGIAGACTSPGAATPPTTTTTTNPGGAGGGKSIGSTGFAGIDAARPALTTDAARENAWLGFGSLPFTGTARESLGSLVVLLGVVGLLLLYLRRRGLTWELATARVGEKG